MELNQFGKNTTNILNKHTASNTAKPLTNTQKAGLFNALGLETPLKNSEKTFGEKERPFSFRKIPDSAVATFHQFSHQFPSHFKRLKFDTLMQHVHTLGLPIDPEDLVKSAAVHVYKRVLERDDARSTAFLSNAFFRLTHSTLREYGSTLSDARAEAIIRASGLFYFDDTARLVCLAKDHTKARQSVNFMQHLRDQTITPADRDAVPMPSHLSDAQTEAAFTITDHPLSLVTGAPGTGKTTILRAAAEAMQHMYAGTQFIAIAPTHVALKRMRQSIGDLILEARTVAYVALQAEAFISTLLKHIIPGHHKRLHIFIDESSMIPEAQFGSLCSSLDSLLITLDTYGVQLSLSFVGDIDQIPPIGRGEPFRTLIESQQLPHAHLTENFRAAKTPGIIRLTETINRGGPVRASDFEDEEHVRFISVAEENLENTIVSLLKLHNAFQADKKVQILTPYKTKSSGPLDIKTMHLNYIAQPHINPAAQSLDTPHIVVRKTAATKDIGVEAWDMLKELQAAGEVDPSGARLETWHVGDMVMCTKNHKRKDVYNGDVFWIAALRKNIAAVDLRREDGRTVRLPLDQFKSDFELAYALTFHKTQGAEYDVVIVVLPIEPGKNPFLTRNMIYTAVSRAKHSVIVLGSDFTLSQIARNPHIPGVSILASRLMGALS